MPREATVIISYKSDFTEAKADYEEFRREVEGPLRVGGRGGSKVGETATFASGEGVAPDASMPNASERRDHVRTPGEAGIEQAVANRFAVVSQSQLGGTGGIDPLATSLFRLPPGVVPPGARAFQNTAYGNATRLFGTNPYDFGQSAERAVARLPDPLAHVAATPTAQQQAANDRPPLITPPPSREIVLRQATDLARPRVQGAGTLADPFRVTATRVDAGPGEFGDDVLDAGIRRSAASERLDAIRAAGGRGAAEVLRERAAAEADVAPAGGRSSLGGNTGRPDSFEQSLRTALRRGGLAFAAQQTLTGVLEGQNQFALATAQAAGDPFALARAKIENDPARRFVESVPLVGGLVSATVDGLGNFLNAGPASRERTLVAAQFRDQVTTANVARAGQLRSATQAASVADASLAGGDSGQVQAIQNSLANGQQTRQEIISTNGAAARQQLLAATERLNQARDALPTSGIGLLVDAGTGRLRGLNAEFEAAQAARDSAQRQVNQVGDGADAIVAANAARDVARLRGITQSATDTTNATRLGVSLSAGAAAASTRGDLFEAIRQNVLASTQPQIEQSQIEADRANDRYLNNSTPDTIDANRAIRDRAAAQLESQRQQQAVQLQQAGQDRARFIVGQRGELAAGRASLGFNPLAAQLAGNQSTFDQAIITGEGTGTLAGTAFRAAPGSVQYEAARQQKDLADRQANQQNTLARLRVDNSLVAENASLDRSLVRDPVGAEAQGQVGDAINRIQSLRQAGLSGEAEQARANSIKQLDVLRNDYKFSFSGVEADAQNNAIFNVKNSQDPSSVFGHIDDAQNQIRGANAEQGIEKPATIGDDGIEKIAAGVAKGIGTLLTN